MAQPAQNPNAPEQGANVIVLPAPPTAPPTSTNAAQRTGGLDWFAGFLVLALAFLIASFPARNSDLWFHLAAGRRLAEGLFSFGTDPFCYTTEHAYWADHSWFYDVAMYLLYGLVGGAGLVIIKAISVVILAWLLLRVRRLDGPFWISVVCTSLAILAMSPRLLLQPACASSLLLGLTLWLLWRTQQEPSPHSQRLAVRHFMIPVLFAVWVNIDEWFLLGPILVASFWLGERWEGKRSIPGWLAPLGLAACLVNPHTYHAFVLPAESAPVTWTSGLRQDMRFQGIFASVWDPGYLQATARFSAAAVAFWALVVLGVLSFASNWRGSGRGRLVVWLPFALLAVCHVRAILFFAVVAGPMAALNWQDSLVSRKKNPAFRILKPAWIIVPVQLTLLALAWPGWLAGRGVQGNHVGWDVQAEPSLQRAADTLNYWRQERWLQPGERVFAVAPEFAQYGAWFDPEDKHFLDHRYGLFYESARDFETVCRAIVPGLFTSPESGANGGEKDWRQVFRENRVAVVVFYDRDPRRLFSVLNRLANDWQHWTILHVAGQALIAGWNESRPEHGFDGLAFDADRLAYSEQDERCRRELPAAPDVGPERLPPPTTFWEEVARPPEPIAWESMAATVYLHYFHDSARRQGVERFHKVTSRFATGLAGLPALPLNWPLILLPVGSARQVLFPIHPGQYILRDQLGPFFAHLEERPAALPLLAVRAARRAIAANPEDAAAWLRLGQAYLLLRHVTCEHSSEGLLPPLAQLRHVQIVTALEQALRLDPDNEAAHHELALLYGEANFLDQSLEHRHEELRLSRRSGPRPGEDADVFADRIDLLEKDTAKLEALVNDKRRVYKKNEPSLQGERLPMATLALKLGLARLATDEVLLPTSPELLGGPRGLKLEFDLLLSLGRADDVRSLLNDEQLRAKKQGLGYYDIPSPRGSDGKALYGVSYHWPTYEWLAAMQSAAVGDYARAREALGTIRASLQTSHSLIERQVGDFERRIRIVLPGMFSCPGTFLPAYSALTLARMIEQNTSLKSGAPFLLAQQADLLVLEGLLDLEQGAVADAKTAFHAAQDICARAEHGAITYAGRAITAAYLSKLTAAK
jgi:tetratricopeptide (TPR) repeat protein